MASDNAGSPTPEELLGVFPVPTYAQWKAEAERLLKGADFDRALPKRSPEGIEIEPLYTRTHPKTDGIGDPATLDLGIGADWRIAQAPGPSLDPSALGDELACGLDVVRLDLDGCGERLPELLATVPMDSTPVWIETRDRFADAFSSLTEAADRQGLPTPWSADHGVVFAPLERGGAAHDESGRADAFDALADAIRWCEQRRMANVGLLWCRASMREEIRLDAASELAAMLAQGLEAVEALTDRGLQPSRIVGHLRASYLVGSDFFGELAKLRAARLLWGRMLELWKASDHARVPIHARTARRDQTCYDPWVNMLRTTTESLCAAIAGADSIESSSYDEITGAPSEFGRRIARNVQLLLRHESHMDRVADSAAGSWYVEARTELLAEAAWGLLQRIEGGREDGAATDGFALDAELDEVADRRLHDVSTRERSLVGTNAYPNPGEEPLDEADRGEGGQVRRLASELERCRRSIESRPGHERRVFVAGLGPASRYRPRLDFAASFFEAGGFLVERTEGFADIGAAAVAALQSEAPIVVVCALDEAYPTEGLELTRRLRSARPGLRLYLAGRPRNTQLREQLSAAGIDRFLHLRSDAVEEFAELDEDRGVGR